MTQATSRETVGLSVVDKLRMLLDITKTISRSLDLQEVLNLVMDTLDSLIPYDAAGIYLVKHLRPTDWQAGDEETTVFHTEAVRGYDIADMQELHLKMGEGLIGHVAVSAQPFISPDVRKEPRYVNARARTRSEMVAPIISNEEVIGVFDLESDELNAYQNDDLEVLMLLASQVAIIIEKVMLHDQLIEKQRLETQLEVAHLFRRHRAGGHAAIIAQRPRVGRSDVDIDGRAGGKRHRAERGRDERAEQPFAVQHGDTSIVENRCLHVSFRSARTMPEVNPSSRRGSPTRSSDSADRASPMEYIGRLARRGDFP